MRAAVAFLQRRPDVEHGRIGGIGLSVGGETLLQTAAESNGLKAIVSDGAGARSIREDVTLPGWRNWTEVPTSFIVSAGTAVFSNRLPPPNLEGLVRRMAPRPLLFIYGQHDQPNVRALTPSYYKAARGAQSSLAKSQAPDTQAASTLNPKTTSGAWSPSSTGHC